VGGGANKLKKKKTKKPDFSGERGGPKNLFNPKTYFFCDLKPHVKFGNPTLPYSFWEKSNNLREKEKECLS
jgi:hypothetical protein